MTTPSTVRVHCIKHTHLYIFFCLFWKLFCSFSHFLILYISSLSFVAHREMRTTTNYFLLNLSVADLLMSSLNCMFNFIYMLNSDWPFGGVYCSVNNFMGNVTVATSVFTLVAISFNRYVWTNQMSIYCTVFFFFRWELTFIISVSSLCAVAYSSHLLFLSIDFIVALLKVFCLHKSQLFATITIEFFLFGINFFLLFQSVIAILHTTIW